MTIMHIDLKMGESLTIGDTTIEAAKKDGQRVRLVVRAPADTKIITPKAQRQGQHRTHECAPYQRSATHGQYPV